MLANFDGAKLGRSALRWMAWFHRWAGILLCLLFAAWFASGAVLTFVPFPSLGETARVAGSEAINLSRITVAPAAALAQAGGAGKLSLVSVAGRPVYLVAREGMPVTAIAADSGSPFSLLGSSKAREVASGFSHEAVTAVTGPFAYDQWVVHNQFDPARPFYRVNLSDPARTDLYVSGRTGQVLQRTTQSQRLWNWCGAVLHWIYFTPIRANWSFWDQLVWWTSLVSVVVVVAGIWLGFQKTLKLWSLGRKKLTPFRGWLGWHHIIGLFASVFVLTWMVSGWLSMDHGRLFSRGTASENALAHFAGQTPMAAAKAVSLQDLRRLHPASQIDFGAVAGQAFIVARGGVYSSPVMIEAGQNKVRTLSDPILLSALAAAWPNAQWSPKGAVPQDDIYALAEGMPAATRRFDQAETGLSVYIDPTLGHVVSVMNGSRRSYAWVYYALHTFNFPGLSSNPFLRYVLILLPLTLGFVFSITGVVIGVQRLTREFHPARR